MEILLTSSIRQRIDREIRKRAYNSDAFLMMSTSVHEGNCIMGKTRVEQATRQWEMQHGYLARQLGDDKTMMAAIVDSMLQSEGKVPARLADPVCQRTAQLGKRLSPEEIMPPKYKDSLENSASFHRLDGWGDDVESDAVLMTSTTLSAYQPFFYDGPVLLDETLTLRIGLCEESVVFPCLAGTVELPVWGQKTQKVPHLLHSLLPEVVYTANAYVDRCSGRVLVLGDFLGFYTFCLSQKPDVESVTLVQPPNIAPTVEDNIICGFDQKDKISVVAEEPMEYLHRLPADNFDTALVSLWETVQSYPDVILAMAACDKIEGIEFIIPFEEGYKLTARNDAISFISDQVRGGQARNQAHPRTERLMVSPFGIIAIDKYDFFDDLFGDRKIESLSELDACLNPDNYPRWARERGMA